MANWIWTPWEFHLFSHFAHVSLRHFCEIQSSGRGVCVALCGMGSECLVVVCVSGIPNRKVAGSDNSQSSNTIKEHSYHKQRETCSSAKLNTVTAAMLFVGWKVCCKNEEWETREQFYNFASRKIIQLWFLLTFCILFSSFSTEDAYKCLEWLA